MTTEDLVCEHEHLLLFAACAAEFDSAFVSSHVFTLVTPHHAVLGPTDGLAIDDGATGNLVALPLEEEDILGPLCDLLKKTCCGGLDCDLLVGVSAELCFWSERAIRPTFQFCDFHFGICFHGLGLLLGLKLFVLPISILA